MQSHSLKIMALHKKDVTWGHKLQKQEKLILNSGLLIQPFCMSNPLHQELVLHKRTTYNNRTSHSKFRCVEKLYVIQ